MEHKEQPPYPHISDSYENEMKRNYKKSLEAVRAALSKILDAL